MLVELGTHRSAKTASGNAASSGGQDSNLRSQAYEAYVERQLYCSATPYAGIEPDSSWLTTKCASFTPIGQRQVAEVRFELTCLGL